VIESSQTYAENNLQNQIPQTMGMVRLAREHGAIAASAFGAGFGGSVWTLVPREHSEQFASEWLNAYKAKFPQQAGTAKTVTTDCVGGAMRII
jgi:galactokinase